MHLQPPCFTCLGPQVVIGGIHSLAWHFKKALRGSSISVSACGLTSWPLQLCFVWAENKMKLLISGAVNPCRDSKSLKACIRACCGVACSIWTGRIYKLHCKCMHLFLSTSWTGYDEHIPPCFAAIYNSVSIWILITWATWNRGNQLHSGYKNQKGSFMVRSGSFFLICKHSIYENWQTEVKASENDDFRGVDIRKVVSSQSRLWTLTSSSQFNVQSVCIVHPSSCNIVFAVL